MEKGFLKANLTTVQKICFAGIFIAVVTILQKVLAINYIPVVPFLRISLGGPAVIIFSSIFLGPIYGMCIGALSDILGYFLLDPKMMGYLPQITAIYALLGLVPYFIFWLFKLIKNEKVMFVIEGVSFVGLIAGITAYLFLNDNLQLYGSTYTLALWQKILIPSILLFLWRKKKSLSVLLRTGISPLTILCALVTIRLCCACLKISLSLTTGIIPLSIRSPRTFPGPTDGSWSESPTSTSLHPRGRARITLSKIKVSTIETSSTISASHLS